MQRGLDVIIWDLTILRDEIICVGFLQPISSLLDKVTAGAAGGAAPAAARSGWMA